MWCCHGWVSQHSWLISLSKSACTSEPIATKQMFQSLNFNLASSRLLTEAHREFLLKSGADNLRLECVITGHNTLRNSEKTLPNLRADSISLGDSQSFYLCLYFSLSVHYPVSQCTSHFSSSHTCTTLGMRWKTQLLWCHCWIEALFKSWILLLNNFQRKKKVDICTQV